MLIFLRVSIVYQQQIVLCFQMNSIRLVLFLIPPKMLLKPYYRTFFVRMLSGGK